MTNPSSVEAQFWRVFARVMGRKVEPGAYARSDLPEWDSLRHVELVFELEETFGIQVPQDEIASLFSDTGTVLRFVRRHAAGS
jgi:acyl carrier protein